MEETSFPFARSVRLALASDPIAISIEPIWVTRVDPETAEGDLPTVQARRRRRNADRIATPHRRQPKRSVWDPFCCCGTAIAVAQQLNRNWIGIDITHLAIRLITHKLRDTFGDTIADTYDVVGSPVSLSGAKALAKQDRFQFQIWALGLVGARSRDPKKDADKGINGELSLHD